MGELSAVYGMLYLTGREGWVRGHYVSAVYGMLYLTGREGWVRPSPQV